MSEALRCVANRVVCLEIELDVVLGFGVQHQPHEPVAVGKRQGTVKDGVAQGKARRREPDAGGQRDDDRDREDRLFRDEAKREADFRRRDPTGHEHPTKRPPLYGDGFHEITKDPLPAGYHVASVEAPAMWRDGRFTSDVRYGARLLVRQRGFAAVATLTTALAIGVAATLFSVFDAVLLRPLPWPRADRLVRFT